MCAWARTEPFLFDIYSNGHIFNGLYGSDKWLLSYSKSCQLCPLFFSIVLYSAIIYKDTHISRGEISIVQVGRGVFTKYFLFCLSIQYMSYTTTSCWSALFLLYTALSLEFEMKYKRTYKVLPWAELQETSDHLHGAQLLEIIHKHLDMAAITNVSNHADDVVCKEPAKL